MRPISKFSNVYLFIVINFLRTMSLFETLSLYVTYLKQPLNIQSANNFLLFLRDLKMHNF